MTKLHSVMHSVTVFSLLFVFAVACNSAPPSVQPAAARAVVAPKTIHVAASEVPAQLLVATESPSEDLLPFPAIDKEAVASIHSFSVANKTIVMQAATANNAGLYVLRDGHLGQFATRVALEPVISPNGQFVLVQYQGDIKILDLKDAGRDKGSHSIGSRMYLWLDNTRFIVLGSDKATEYSMAEPTKATVIQGTPLVMLPYFATNGNGLAVFTGHPGKKGEVEKWNQIFLYDGTALKQITPSGDYEYEASAIDTNGNILLVSNKSGMHTLYMPFTMAKGAKTDAVVLVDSKDIQPENMRLSPGGTQIAYLYSHDLFVKLDRSEPQRLTTYGGVDQVEWYSETELLFTFQYQSNNWLLKYDLNSKQTCKETGPYLNLVDIGEVPFC